MSKPESFEVTEYSAPGMDVGLAYRALRQIMVEQQRTTATQGVWIDLSGDTLKIHFHSYEMHLPSRIKQVEDRAHTAIKETVSLLKKEFKSRTKHELKLVEDKSAANYAVEKVSLNERYYFKSWRFYKLSFE